MGSPYPVPCMHCVASKIVLLRLTLSYVLHRIESVFMRSCSCHVMLMSSRIHATNMSCCSHAMFMSCHVHVISCSPHVVPLASAEEWWIWSLEINMCKTFTFLLFVAIDGLVVAILTSFFIANDSHLVKSLCMLHWLFAANMFCHTHAMPCSCHVHAMFMSRSCHVHVAFMSCSCHVMLLT